MHPFLDTSTLTDDQIYEKLSKCHSYLSMQQHLGHGPAVETIQQTIYALEQEKIARFDKMLSDDIKKTTPNFMDPINLGTLDSTDAGTNEEDKQKRY
jgi:hypothetical protein